MAIAANGTAATLRRMHERMLDDGWSPDDIAAVEGVVLRFRLHDLYLAAGYSPDDVEAVVSLY
jgi:hypothetical protein